MHAVAFPNRKRKIYINSEKEYLEAEVASLSQSSLLLFDTLHFRVTSIQHRNAFTKKQELNSRTVFPPQTFPLYTLSRTLLFPTYIRRVLSSPSTGVT